MAISAHDIRSRILERWAFYELFRPNLNFYNLRMKFFLTLNLPDDSWYDFKHILETVIAEKLEKEGK